MNTGQSLGDIIFFIGLILAFGNLTGWWSTFSYAGFITMAIGAVIMRLSKEFE